jgi:hypothetical protein
MQDSWISVKRKKLLQLNSLISRYFGMNKVSVMMRTPHCHLSTGVSSQNSDGGVIPPSVAARDKVSSFAKIMLHRSFLYQHIL